MDDERLVGDVNYSTDSIARSEGRQGSWVVLDDTVVIAVLNLLICPLQMG